MKIGIISDTHGRLSEKVFEHFKGVEAIFHAGDIGSISIIEGLKKIAPVHAVSGNMDRGSLAKRFPKTKLVDLNGFWIYMIHELFLIDVDPDAAGINCVIFGHTHTPHIEKKEGILFINPGSAGVPRLGQRPTVMVCHINGKDMRPILLEL